MSKWFNKGGLYIWIVCVMHATDEIDVILSVIDVILVFAKFKQPVFVGLVVRQWVIMAAYLVV